MKTIYVVCALILIVFAFIYIVSKLCEPDDEDYSLVLDAIDQIFPESSFLNILTYLEDQQQSTIHTAWLYGVIKDLIEAKMIAGFTKDGINHKPQKNGQILPVVFYQITGRKGKPKTNKKSTTLQKGVVPNPV